MTVTWPLQVGPGSTLGLSMVLAYFHPRVSITCDRAAEVLVIPGWSVRAAIAECGSAGEQLERELW